MNNFAKSWTTFKMLFRFCYFLKVIWIGAIEYETWVLRTQLRNIACPRHTIIFLCLLVKIIHRFFMAESIVKILAKLLCLTNLIILSTYLRTNNLWTSCIRIQTRSFLLQNSRNFFQSLFEFFISWKIILNSSNVQ